ncbi:hypothetical protein GF339_07395 [candidate division KSB3 bacterium]|uniref:Uncharacterized protein n=1 Tax=candidate division KSB3 bacterium TaxID=2044937 RepID=A0A9D5JUJ7_9BACT|nr:hypothetical protein [candidate division KSB3 bacterium]MBD3324394.1 hypothetical protein [candidate division KSB3 bacterium]
MMNTGLYQPLEEILVHDDFDHGLQGWVNLTPNFRQDAMEYFPTLQGYTDWGPPMLSSATFSYVGTHGSLTGTYSMKIGTKPVAGKVTDKPAPGSMGHAIKRFTYLKRQLLKCEAWYTFKAEQDRPGIGEQDIRAFGFMWDIQDDEKRYFCGARYMNAAGGKMQQRWQYLRASEGTDEAWGDVGQSAMGHDADGSADAPKVYLKRGIDPQWRGQRYADGGGDAFQDVPGGHQQLCYNETADKINWHYFALTIDLAKREYVELASVNKVFDLRGCAPTTVEAYPRINYLLNPIFWIEADTQRRVFLFVDSVVISTGKGV